MAIIGTIHAAAIHPSRRWRYMRSVATKMFWSRYIPTQPMNKKAWM